MQPVRRWIAFGLAALVVAGCSSSDASAPATSAAEVTTSVAETTPPTTPATSTSTTAAATTTLPATTTTVATEDLIKQAVQDYLVDFYACGQAPAQCDAAQFTATMGSSRGTVTDLARDMSESGLYFSSDLRGTYPVVESVSMVSDTEASAVYCVYDALIVLGPNGPDGLPTVVNDAISSSRYTYHAYLEAERWMVGSQEQLERLGEGSLCPTE